MLKIKIVTAFLFVIIASCFIASRTASQARNEIDKSVTTKLSVVVEESQIKCKVEAYGAGLADDKPKTSIVRAKPDKNSSVLKTVTTKDEVIFYITGSNGNGWFEISKVETTGTDVDETLFQGRGWVHSSLVGTSVGNSDARLYTAPQKKSRILKKLIADESTVQPVGCKGDWMQVKFGKLIGWLSREGQCPNPLTTCS
jgi:SH3-like domain-containing protein